MERYTVRLESRQSEVVESMAENGDVENPSEAIRDAIEHYAQSMGYVNGHKRDTTLRWGCRRAADLFAQAALIWLVFTMWFSSGYQLAAIPMFAIAVAFYSADRLLGRYEPHVSHWFARGERA